MDNPRTLLAPPALPTARDSVSTGPQATFRTDIQALRAIAVGLVVVYHAGVSVVSGGYIGVDVFFVISGFLITQHLISSMERGTFTFGSFYVKRARRILPAALAVVVATILTAWAVVPTLELGRILEDAVATALYVPNVLFWVQGTDYLAATEPSLFQHYWSLGIEEQFYLLWPLLIWLLFRLTQGSPRGLRAGVTAVVVLSFTACVVLTVDHQPLAFFMLPTRAWELGAGGLVALGVFGASHRLHARIRRGLGLTGLAALLLCALLYSDDTTFPSYWAAIPVLATMLVIWAGPYEGLLGRTLELRGVQWLGTVSYSVYLVHWPLLVMPAAASGWLMTLPLWATLLLAVASLPLAWLSYRFVETPFRRPRKGSAAGLRKPAVAAIAASVIIAGLAFAGTRVVAATPADSGTTAEAFAPTAQPDGATTVASNLSVPLDEARTETAIPSGKGCHLSVGKVETLGCTYGSEEGVPAVALVGDSHAAQWAPALEGLAEDGHITLTAHTKDGCPLIDRSTSGELTETDECRTWQAKVHQALQASPPDILVTSTSINGRVKKSVEAYEIGLRAALEAVSEQSQVVVITDTPRFPADPLLCLSGHLDSPNDCSIPRNEAVPAEFVEANRRVTEEFGAFQLDLTDYMCADTCFVIQDSMLVFKDAHHITRSFSESMQPIIRQQFADRGLLR